MMMRRAHLVYLAGLYGGILVAAPAARAQSTLESIMAQQQAVQLAETRAKALETERDRLHRETLKALNRHDAATFSADEKREADNTIGTLQTTAALRSARQALAEAVNDAAEQGEALEHAAARAASGEVAPSVVDLLSCDGPDCMPISAREHAAMVMMGAVGPTFDPAKWDAAASPVTVLAYDPNALPLAALRRAAKDAADQAQRAVLQAAAAQATLRTTSTAAAMDAYAQALAATDVAESAKRAADQRLQDALRAFADDGRALKRAALLAGDGYALASDGRKVCRGAMCLPAEGREAAAFLVIGAAQDVNGGVKRFGAFVTRTADGRVVFHA
jgi:hypothetical protein